jgi:hypothetical protein
MKSSAAAMARGGSGSGEDSCAGKVSPGWHDARYANTGAAGGSIRPTLASAPELQRRELELKANVKSSLRCYSFMR